MWSSNRIGLWLCLLWLIGSHNCDDLPDSIVLDENLRKLALNLFKAFSNKTQLAELITDGGGDGQLNVLEKFPTLPVAEIYRNYTLEQIKALELELSQHNHFIYDPIEEKAKEMRSEFGRACQSYDQNGDLKEFEQKFLQTGNELVSLQKMVIRIINSKLENKLKQSSKTNYRSGRNWVYNLFDNLSHLFLGGSQSDLYKSSDYSQVNKMYVLIQALERIENVQPTDEQTKQNVDRLRNLLFRLRKIYQLNKIASVPNVYLNTEYLSPYNYEAMLRLVQLLGTAQSIGQQFNPLMTLFRSWMNFFNGGNIFASLTNPFGGQTPSNRPKYNANKIRTLIRLIEENDRIRQQEIERNRQKLALENLLKNQNKQQQQIDEILKAIVNNKNNNNQPTTDYSTFRPPWVSPSATRWPTMRPVPSSPGDVLKQLKEQRRHLNELLQDLQKPMANQPSNGGNSWPNNGGSSLPSNSGTKTPTTGFPTNQDIMQAQQALMGIMKNITPMINLMGQSGMVSMPRLEQSKFQLLDILKAVNGRELDEVEDTNKEIQRVEQLGEKLESVLDGIIDEAEKTNTL